MAEIQTLILQMTVSTVAVAMAATGGRHTGKVSAATVRVGKVRGLHSSGMLCGVSRQLVTLTPEDGTGRMSRNVRNQISSYVVKYPRRAQNWTTPAAKA
jgi:hypothetical protein